MTNNNQGKLPFSRLLRNEASKKGEIPCSSKDVDQYENKESPRCALHVKEFREAVFKVMREVEGGVWAAAINGHFYHLVTLWNVKDLEVKVVHFNFCGKNVMEMAELHSVSKRYLQTLGITPVITLQDGERVPNLTALPLIHMTTKHMINYFKYVDISKRDGAVVNQFHMGSVFTSAASISGFEEQWKRTEIVFDNKGRGNFNFDDQLFSEEVERKFVGVVEQITRDKPDFIVHQRALFAAIFAACRLLWGRKHLTTSAELLLNSEYLIPHLRFLDRIFTNKVYSVGMKPQQNYFSISVKAYLEVLEKHKDIPYEIFIFSFDYEISKYTKNIGKNFSRHPLIDRLKNGIVYAAGTFSCWPGSSNKKVTFLPISCSEATLDMLLEIIDPVTRLQMRSRPYLK